LFYIKRQRYFGALEPLAVVNTQALIEDNHMSRHLDNLKRLYLKLQLRYGEDDALVLQVKEELAARELLQTKHKNWTTPYREFIKSSALNSP
jgi:hypothetical protein